MRGGNDVFDMRLSFFTDDESFPFFIQYGGHDKDLFSHRHKDFSELVVVLDGKATHVVNGESYPISKGEVFCIGTGISHGYENPENFRICNIMFRQEALLAADSDVKTLSGFHALFVVEPQINGTVGFESRMRLSASDFSRIEQLIALTIDEYSGEREGKKTLLQAYFVQLVVLLSRLYGLPERHIEIECIANAAAYIEGHYMDDSCMDGVLGQLHYSRRHFIRLFTAAYGMPPIKYLLGVRMRRAAALLRETNLPVTEVAMRCGFNDANYFSRAFKKSFGKSPNSFRSGG